MTTTRDELIGFVENLYVPQIPSAGLTSVIATAQESIIASILLFASGDGDEQPNLVNWLDQQELLDEGALDEPLGESVMADNYSSHLDEIQGMKDEMEQQNRSVADSVLQTFSLTDATYLSIRERVSSLDNDLRSVNERTDDEGNYLPLTATEEDRAIYYLLHAVDDVYHTVDVAYTQISAQADNINESTPSIPSAIDGGDSASSASAASYDTQPTPSYAWGADSGPHNDIVEAAAAEIGTTEEGANFVPGKPYNLDGLPWCASFATWAWERAGYNVDWTNKNYVPDIWKDAKSRGWAAGASSAEPGDMIIFDWQGDGNPDHVGIVESVSDSGAIYTIEGNSGNMVDQNTYAVENQQDIVGVVKPPSPEARV